MGSDELLVKCLNCNRKTKIEKPIKNHLDLFINTRLNHIRSRLVKQPNKKLNSNSDQSIDSTDLSPITFGIILPSKLRGKISTNSQINPITSDKNRNYKVRIINILLDSSATASIVRKDVLYKCHKILKTKRINGQLWQGLLIRPLHQK